MIVAHGNSLRGLIKYLDNISDEDIMKVKLRNIPIYFGSLCLVETLIIEGNDGFTVGNRYLK